MSRDELAQKYRLVYGHSRNESRDCNTLWRFYNDIVPGDIIIARRGTKKVVGIGLVTGPAFHDEQKGRERVGNLTDLYYYPNLIAAKWEAKEIPFDKAEFAFYTMYEIPEERYQELIGVPPQDELIALEIVLEKHLEDHIVANFNAIFRGQLELYVDPEGNKGQQYPVVGDTGKEIGRIDILAREPATGSYVVLELKKGREADAVVGQTLSYMGWVQETLCQGGEGVKGLIICKDQHERLRFALKALPPGSISLKFYTLSFGLRDDPGPAQTPPTSGKR